MKEKKGLGEIGRREERREGRVKGRIVLGIMMMMVMMVMGCNSGGVGEGEEGKNKFLQSLVNVSNEFLNVFTSFGDIVGSVLGLNLESKKSDVGKYFKTMQGTVEGIKSGLNKIVSEMKEEKNPNAAGVESAVNKLVTETLDKIIDGAKEASEAIGIAGDELLGNVAAAGSGGVVGDGVEKIVKGIKGIVEVVLKGVGKADAGDDKKAEDGNTARNANAGDGEAGKLFSSGNAGEQANAKKVATDAAKAVGGVRGADILEAIVEAAGDASKLATAKNPGAAPKDAVIAGGIALRAIAKNGKFAGPSAAVAEYNTGVKNTVVSAVTKALDTLTVAIRKTIDLGLKNVKDSMRINSNATPVVSDKDASGAKNQ
ncbi:Variable outer membrane protein (plasmid) [Borrelia crocidurae DOU]|uniref:Variable large protein n=1 Tax=Borrelia crocidurae DOU TaxID=1293575 RepID=W5SKH4_9SPIR|nr:variable large family protein [Borrelia crocidurae]AHH07669.1 Variable outer membrane protein [Borrelia crocidurae DOU]